MSSLKRREFLRRAGTASLLSLLPRSGMFAESASPLKRPNVLFLFSDQHNARMLSCAGNGDVRTPHMDRLAAEGVRFERAYCQDGVCVASRNSMMTGQYPRTTGLLTGDMVRPLEPVLARFTPMQRAFQKAGYYTFTSGKRHLQGAVDAGWDYKAGIADSKEELSDPVNYWKWIAQQGLMKEFREDWGSVAWPHVAGAAAAVAPMTCRISALPAYATMEGFVEAQTVAFLKSAQAKKGPFFAYSSYLRPHQPYTPLKEYADKVDAASLTLPKSFAQRAEELPPILHYYRNKTDGGPWSLGKYDEADYRRYLAYYIALVEEVDDHIGRTLKTLEEEGLAENTIVVYSADHGDFTAHHRLPEKFPMGHNFYEETLRVPLMVRYPNKIGAGEVRNDLVQLVDIYPTLLEFCGMDAPKDVPLAGMSLVEALSRKKAVGRDHIVSESLSQLAVITEDLKYGQWLASPLKGGPWGDFRSFGNMLMSRATDPDEVVNLCGDASYAAKRAEMEGWVRDWVRNTNDDGRRAFYQEVKAEYPEV